MASACVNNISMSPETFPAATYPSYGWLSPRISFSREFPEDIDGSKKHQPPPQAPPLVDLEPAVGDFEFRLEDPVAMLPADELFSDGKLVPLQLSLKPSSRASISTIIDARVGEKMDPYIFSPKAPRCSSRWRELLGLKKLCQNSKNGESIKTTPFSSSASGSSKAMKNLLHRSSKSSISSSDAASLSLPLLKDSDSETISISSSRLSLSSSSSGHEHEDLPRLSLETDPNPFKAPNPNPPRMRLVKPCSSPNPRPGRSPMRRSSTVSVNAAAESSSAAAVADSPRMNSSGKIIFHSLERSSSSPSSFNGGPRFKHRGMERSYSANVRITPVLNVPVCSLRGSSKSGSVFGFGQLFSSLQKRDNTTRTSRNRTDRTDRP